MGDILLTHSKKVIQTKPVESYHSVIVPIQSVISDIKPTLLRTYNISEGGNPMFVSGCDLLPNGDFVIADQQELFVKYYNHQGVLTKHINTENDKPFDVCLVDNTTCAISTDNETYNNILFVDIMTNKPKKNMIWGNALKFLFFDTKLIVSNYELGNDKGVVMCIDADGRIVNRFTTNALRGICFSNNMFYYNEYEPCAVVCSDKSGNIEWRYQDPSILYPNGIVVDERGFVFVSCPLSDSIVVIYPDGKSSKVVLSKKDGLNLPFALAMYRKGRKLIVCNREDGNVLLYQL